VLTEKLSACLKIDIDLKISSTLKVAHTSWPPFYSSVALADIPTPEQELS
jgi:hypothetical protein